MRFTQAGMAREIEPWIRGERPGRESHYLARSSHNAIWQTNHMMLFRASLEWLTRGSVNGTKEGNTVYGILIKHEMALGGRRPAWRPCTFSRSLFFRADSVVGPGIPSEDSRPLRSSRVRGLSSFQPKKAFRRQHIRDKESARVLRSSRSRMPKTETGEPAVSVDLLIRALFTIGTTPEELGRVIGSSAS